MTDKNRLERLEGKVDTIKEDIFELKSEFKVHVVNMENKLDTFEKHIAGDNKIINHISPIIEKFPVIIEIVEEYNFEKKKKAERNSKIKAFSIKAGIVGTIITAITAIIAVL